MKIESVEITWTNYNGDVDKYEYYLNANFDFDNRFAVLSTAKFRTIADGQVLKTETAYSGASYDLKFTVLIEHTRSIKRPVTYQKQIWYIKF